MRPQAGYGGGSGKQWAGAGWILKEEPTGFADDLDVEDRTLGSSQALAGLPFPSLGCLTPAPWPADALEAAATFGFGGRSPAQREACILLGSALPHPGWESGQASPLHSSWGGWAGGDE